MSTWSTPSAISPEMWYRLLEAFNAGAPPLLACEYAGVEFETWLAECGLTPEFRIVAKRVRASGAIACLLFIQRTAATDPKLAAEFLKLAFPEFFGTARTREAPPTENMVDDDPAGDVTPDDVAAVIRILRANGLGGGEGPLDGEVEGHRNGRPAPSGTGSNTAGEVAG
jgi:hypothetical protein